MEKPQVAAVHDQHLVEALKVPAAQLSSLSLDRKAVARTGLNAVDVGLGAVEGRDARAVDIQSLREAPTRR